MLELLGSGVHGASQDGETLLELVVGDDEGHEGADAVAVLARAEEQESLLQGGLDNPRCPLLVRGATPGVLDELHRGHWAPAAHVAGEVRVRLLYLAHRGHDALAQRVRLAEEVFRLEALEHGEGGVAGYRVPAVGGAKAAGVDGIHDLRLPSNAGYGETPAHALGRGENVRRDPRVLDGEHLARAAEARLDLVHDQDDAALVAQFPELPEVEVRERYEAALPADRLDDDRRDAARVHRAHERLLYSREAVALATAGTVLAHRAAVSVGRRHPIDLGDERPEAPLVRVGLAGKGHREHRAAVEGVLEGDHRGTPRVVARDLDRVLDRLGPVVDEERALLGTTGDQSVEPLGQLYVALVLGDVEAGVGKPLGLLLDCLDHPGICVPDVHHPDAAAEVYEGVAVDIGEQGPLRFIGEHRRRDPDARRDGAVPPLHQRPALRHLFLSASRFAVYPSLWRGARPAEPVLPRPHALPGGPRRQQAHHHEDNEAHQHPVDDGGVREQAVQDHKDHHDDAARGHGRQGARGGSASPEQGAYYGHEQRAA